MRFETLPSVDVMLIHPNTAVVTDLGCVAFKQSDSKIYAAKLISAAFTFGASGASVTTGVWYRIDYNINMSANPWTIDAQVDGVALGQVTQSSAASSTTTHGCGMRPISGTFTGDAIYDDFVMSHTSADYPIGAGYVNHFVPTSDGTHNIAGTGDFQRTLTGTDILNATTTAYQLLDDVPLDTGASVDWINMVAPPNATDYVECVFGPAPGISTPIVAPRAVEVMAGYHQAGTGAGNMEVRINDNGTTNAMYTATGVAGVTSVVITRKHYATAIAGGGAWTVTSGNGNFNNLRVRFGSPAAVDANPDQYLDCMMIEAEFPAPAAGTEFIFYPPMRSPGNPNVMYAPSR